MCDGQGSAQGDAKISGSGLPEDIEAMLERGVVALHASGHLSHEDAVSDRALVLAIVDAVFPVSGSAD